MDVGPIGRLLVEAAMQGGFWERARRGSQAVTEALLDGTAAADIIDEFFGPPDALPVLEDEAPADRAEA